MIWAAPAWGFALFAVAALALVMGIAGRLHRAKLRQVFTGGMFNRVLPLSVRVRRTLRDGAYIAGGIAIVVALAEPKFGEKVLTVEATGVDIVAVVDLSRSMDCRDVDPTRIERARREISDLLELMQGDRIGLVMFAGAAFPRMPLTEDYDAMRLVSDELDTQMFQVQGSALDEAIDASLKLLQAKKSNSDQAILVLSDGEIHDPDRALAAASRAKSAGVRVFAIGIGEKPSPIPQPDGTFLEEGGQVVLSAPSDEVLTEIAKITGGAFVHSVAANTDVAQMYKEEIRSRLKAGDRGTMQRKTSETGYQWPLLFGVCCWLFGAWIGDGRRPWGQAAVRVAVALFLLVPLAANAASEADGDALYRAGRYPEAVKVFTEITQNEPTNTDAWRRLAEARYRTGDYEGAARAYETQSELSGGDPTALFNAGNAHYYAHRLEEAISRYDESLKLAPNPTTTANRKVVSDEITARRQQQNQPPPPPKQNDGESSEKDAGSTGDPKESPPKDGDPSDQKTEKDPQEKPSDGSKPQDSPPPGQQAKSKQQEGEQGDDSKTGQQTDQEREAGDSKGAQSPSELEPGEQAPGDPAGGGGQPAPDGSMSKTQADKLLDGVEEGRPRVVVPGNASDGKPW